MKTYLVTGGAGFIGANYIKYLFDKYDKDVLVINYDALTYAGNRFTLEDVEERSNYHFIHGNICNRELLTETFELWDIDYVVNFAAESHVDRSIENPAIFVETNVLGTQTLLDVAMLHWQLEDTLSGDDGFMSDKKYLQVSTDEVYGSLGKEGFFTETTPLNPHSPYSASKAAADMLVKSYYDTFGFPVNITRCSNNYGPYQYPEKLIPLMIVNARDGEKLPVYGDGKNIRDWLYVVDHCRAIDMVVHKGAAGEIYNIGGHNEKENIEIVKIILNRLGQSEELIAYVEDRKGHDRRYGIDPYKIGRDIGWQPQIMFDEGIITTIDWYIKNEPWLDAIRAKGGLI